MRARDLKKLIEENLPHAIVTVESDDEVHFSADILCPAFEGKSRLAQQQMVYQIVNPYIKDGTIHALSLKTRAK